MILSNQIFSRREPVKDAKSIYIFCEGKKREYQYFHFFNAQAIFQWLDMCDSWKEFLSKNLGGFDAKKHPFFIEKAIKKQYTIESNAPKVGSTEVFKLAMTIYTFCKPKIDRILHRI